MRVLKYLFGIPGAALTVVSFFLPWIHTTFGAGRISGLGLAQGVAGAPADLLGSDVTAALAAGDSWLWVIFIAGLIGLGAIGFSFAKLEKASTAAGIIQLVGGLVGIAFLFLRTDHFLSRIGSTSTVMLSARALFQQQTQLPGVELSAGIGLILLVIGLFLLIIGGVFSFAPAPIAVPAADHAYASVPVNKAITPSPFPVQKPIPILPEVEPTTFADFEESYIEPPVTNTPHDFGHINDDIESLPTIRDDDELSVFNSIFDEPDDFDPQTFAYSKPGEEDEPEEPATPLTDSLDRVDADGAQAFAWLIVREVRGLESGRSYTISADTYTIGRAAENMLHIADTSVSGSHAEIERTAEKFMLRDLDSSNGTFIFDGTYQDWRMVKQHQLKDGDQIKFGRSVFSFVDVKN